MKNKKLFLATLTIFILSNYSCDSDPCDEGYTQVTENGATYCLPDFLGTIEESTEDGTKFFHTKFGIIELNNGKWTNKIGENITEFLTVEN